MNLSKLFEMQKVLDNHIMDEHPELKEQNNLDWKILALQVELGECANEWRGFKKWSKDQAPRLKAERKVIIPGLEEFDNYEGAYHWVPYNPLLEEYVDGLHFILSIGNEINPKQIPNDRIEPLIGEFKSVLEAFRHVLNWTVNLDYILFEEPFRSDYRIERTYFNLLQVFITLGEMLGFTWLQIEQAYMDKNAVNHQRQESGY